MTTEYDEDYDPMRLPEVKDKMFVLIGPTRSGKSTFINTLIGTQVAEEGKANTIISTTKEVQNYRNLRVVHGEGLE
jgi:ribosome biogenesis GTPase A